MLKFISKMNIPIILQFGKFGLVGLSNTIISYIVYAGLTYKGIPYIIASVFAFVVSVLNSFFWNNKFVFTRNEDEIRNIWKTLAKTFISYAWTGLFLNNILLFLFVEKIHLSKFIAPFCSLIITIPLNFIMNKFWAFKEKKIENFAKKV